MIPSRHLHLIKLKYGRYNMHLKEEVEVVGMGKKGGGGALFFSQGFTWETGSVVKG